MLDERLIQARERIFSSLLPTDRHAVIQTLVLPGVEPHQERGRCQSCGQDAGGPERWRCPVCVAAIVRALQRWRAGVEVAPGAGLFERSNRP